MIDKKITISIYRRAIKVMIGLIIGVSMFFPSLSLAVQASSSNNLLSNVSFSVGKLNYDFSPSRIYYNLTIPENTSKVDVEVTTQDSSATYSVAGHTNISQSSSTGKIVITVTAANGNKKWYTFAIKFSGNKTTTKPPATTPTSKPVTLENIRFDIGKLNVPFTENITDYTLTLPKGTTAIDVSILPATITNVKVSGHQPLDETKPEIVVVSSGKTYRFVVLFEDTSNSVPTNTTNTKNFGLEFLEIKGHTLNKTFQTDVYEYQIVVNKGDENFEVQAIATDEQSMIEVDQDGSRIKIVVSTDEKRATYVIRLLEKNASSDNSMANVMQDLLISVVLLTLAVLLFILSRKVRKERPYPIDEDDNE